ncbi:MAG TPA: ABC transporter substrate-binding protein [Candidatus Eubacterium faecavium]|nr:ABC transporter substrate-binding protein [Candidatus Eubacterium faecavium]
MRKSVKRILALGLSAVLVGSVFAGCTAQNSKYTIGIIQSQQHSALDQATQGFQDAVKKALGEENVEITLQNASGDSATCATIANQFVADGVDLIMANATNALQASMAATADIPIVATSVTDYATALEMSDWTGVTGINVTGTSDLAPLDQQAAMIQELCPDAQTVGILYCSAEPNSVYQAEVVEESLTSMGLSVNIYTCADSNEITSVTTTACQEVDVIYIPTDNTIASAATAVDQIAAPAGIPVIAGEEGICKGCGVATLSISYYDIGYRAGEMAVDILQNGADPSQMQIETATELTKKYVPQRAEALGISIPADYEAIVESAE